MKTKGFSIVELMVVIAIIMSIVIVTGPSFTKALRGPLLKYEAKKLAQSIQKVQSDAFINHNYYQVIFDETNQKVSLSIYDNGWISLEDINLNEKIKLQPANTLNEDKQLIYGPNGNAFTCNKQDSLNQCLLTPLQTLTYTELTSVEHKTRIDFLPFNGYVSYNITNQ